MEETNQWDDYAELYPQIDNELDVPVLLRTALAQTAPRFAAIALAAAAVGAACQWYAPEAVAVSDVIAHFATR